MAGRVEWRRSSAAPGFALREELTGRLGPATAPTHRLEVDFDLEPTGVALTQENVTTRYNVVGIADYAPGAARRRAAGARGRLRASPATARPASQTGSAFASRAAERDAERRLAVDLADQIVQRLALASGPGPRRDREARRARRRALPRQARPSLAGILLYGADAMRVALKRAALVEALIGRRRRRDAADPPPRPDLRRDPAAASTP